MDTYMTGRLHSHQWSYLLHNAKTRVFNLIITKYTRGHKYNIMVSIIFPKSMEQIYQLASNSLSNLVTVVLFLFNTIKSTKNDTFIKHTNTWCLLSSSHLTSHMFHDRYHTAVTTVCVHKSRKTVHYH